MAQAEHVIIQFVVQSAKHHVNPYYYHPGTLSRTLQFMPFKRCKCFLFRIGMVNTQMNIYARYTRQIRHCKNDASVDRGDWSAYCENSRKWCWPFVWSSKWRESNSGHERWPGSRSILQPCNCHCSGRRVCYYRYRVVSSRILLFFYSSSGETSVDPLALVRRRTTGERDGETRCQRRKPGGMRERERSIRRRIKCRLRRSKRYSTRDRWRDQ